MKKPAAHLLAASAPKQHDQAATPDQETARLACPAPPLDLYHSAFALSVAQLRNLFIRAVPEPPPLVRYTCYNTYIANASGILKEDCTNRRKIPLDKQRSKDYDYPRTPPLGVG